MKSMKDEKQKDKDKSDQAEKEGLEGSGLKTAGSEGEITAGLSVHSMLLLCRTVYIWEIFLKFD